MADALCLSTDHAINSAPRARPAVSNFSHERFANAESPRRLRHEEIDQIDNALPLIGVVAKMKERESHNLGIDFGNDSFKRRILAKTVTQIFLGTPIKVRRVAECVQMGLEFGGEPAD